MNDKIDKTTTEKALRPILIITTGGTLLSAKPYGNNPPKNVTEFDPQQLSSALDYIGKTDLCDVYSSMPQLDSKAYDNEKLKMLADYIENTPHTHIIVTHGTDHMAENARALRSLLGDKGKLKTIIFTGAILPLVEGVDKSDGYKNLLYSTTMVDQLSHGVHLVMHQSLYNIDYTQKNMENGVFMDFSKQLPPGAGRSLLILLFVLLTFLFSSPVYAQARMTLEDAAAAYLSDYKDKEYVLLVLAPSMDDPHYKAQMQLLDGDKAALLASHIKVINGFKGKNIRINNAEVPSRPSAMFYALYGISEDEFAAIFIGKDLGTRLYTLEPMTVEQMRYFTDAERAVAAQP